ncbi:PP2C family protein-serine/threonine phosphatase [Streptomyces lydicus]|nr:PP2C family protein-serine/threonine phosphatase [Streptomyces lydicus]
MLLDLPDRWPVLRIINCGHPPPLLLREGQAPLPLYGERTALPIGLGGLAGTPDYEVETFPFAPGDLLLLYTDGVSEARDHKGAFYPLPSAPAPGATAIPSRFCAGCARTCWPTRAAGSATTPPRSRYGACPSGRRPRRGTGAP